MESPGSLLRCCLGIHVWLRAVPVSQVNPHPPELLPPSQAAPCQGGEPVPAVHHDGPSVRGVAGFHPPEEGQEWGGVLGHTMVRPRRELELPHLALLAGAVLQDREHQGSGGHSTPNLPVLSGQSPICRENRSRSQLTL